MSKRLTDTEKWRKPLMRGLEAPYKLLWLYVLDECDHAGIWNVEREIAEIRIGESFSTQEALKKFKNHIREIDNGEKWFIIDFIEFQYGKLNPGNRAHKSVLNILEKYVKDKKLDKGLIRGLTSPLEGAMDKDKDKDKDNRGEYEGGDDVFVSGGHLSISWHDFNKLADKFGDENAKEYVNKVLNYSKNSKYKSLYLTALNWLEKAKREGKLPQENMSYNPLKRPIDR